MRNLAFVFLGNFLISCCFANPDSLKIERLKAYYSKSYDRADSLEFQLLFFEEFPSDFKTFNSIYGYDTSAMPLYDEAYDHVKLFNRISVVSERVYYRKMISIAIGGEWEADAVNYLQDGLRRHVHANTELVFDLLKERTEKEIFKFWFFYFDELFPVKKIPSEFEKDKEQYAIIKRAYYKVLEKNKSH